VRQLYTDQDEVLFDAARPVILNGIEDIVTRPEFLTLEPIPEERRRPEAELWSRGLFRTPSSSSLAPLMGAAFSSAVAESTPGLVPSRVTWIVTIGIVALPAKFARSADGLPGPAPSPRLKVLNGRPNDYFVDVNVGGLLDRIGDGTCDS
jgi:hypothetical protein